MVFLFLDFWSVLTLDSLVINTLIVFSTVNKILFSCLRFYIKNILGMYLFKGYTLCEIVYTFHCARFLYFILGRTEKILTLLMYKQCISTYEHNSLTSPEHLITNADTGPAIEFRRRWRYSRSVSWARLALQSQSLNRSTAGLNSEFFLQDWLPYQG